MDTVGVRQLKNQLSKYLKRVQQGHRIAITERGKVVAILEPVRSPAVPEWLQQMIRDGRVSWAGGKPKGARIHAPGADLTGAVLEGREDRV